MGNYLSLATVTSMFQATLEKVVSADVSDCRVVTEHPEKASNAGVRTPSVNVFLYQATPNLNRRNEDLPTRVQDNVVLRPRVVLDLFYLLSFYGDETDLVPQRLFGLAAAHLNAFPYFDSTFIEDTIESRPFLEGSDLADQVGGLGLTQISVTAEDLSKIWSSFFHHVPYALSMVYKISPVVIDGPVLPQVAKRVDQININSRSKL